MQVDNAHYGPARMLKALGVDQLSLPSRLGEMDPEQLETYSRLYARHMNAVNKRSEEARVCQSFLVNQEFDLALVEELSPRIPFDDANLALLDGGPQGPFTPELETLRAIAAHSPIQNNRLLATLALIRSGSFPYGSPPWRDAWQAAETCLCAGTPLALEAALLYGHWRLTHGATQLRIGLPLSAQQLALDALQHPKYRFWAAVTLASYSIQCSEALRSEINDLVEKALTTHDADLSLSAAVTRGVPALLVRELKAQDATRGIAAALALARRGAADLVPFLERAADEILLALVRAAPDPVPVAWQPCLLKRLQSGSSKLQEVLLEHITLDANDFRDLAEHAKLRDNKTLLCALIRKADDLNLRPLLRTALDSGLFTQDYATVWREVAKRIQLRVENFSAVRRGNADQRTLFAWIARLQIDTFHSRDFFQAVLQDLLESTDSAVANELASTLTFAQNERSGEAIFSFSPANLGEYFPDSALFYSNFIRLLQLALPNHGTERPHYLHDWLLLFVKELDEQAFSRLPPLFVTSLYDALLSLAEDNDVNLYLRADAVGALFPVSLPNEVKQEIVARLKSLKMRGLSYDLVYRIDIALERFDM